MSQQPIWKQGIGKKELDIRLRLKNDFPHYAAKCLKIRSTDGGPLVNFNLNDVQYYIHNKLEEQRKKTGRVRAIILKGRKQGCTTLVKGRFFWKLSHRRGTRAFVLSHQSASTANIFKIIKTFHKHCPTLIRPILEVQNAEELIFSSPSDSSYGIGTARSDNVGRGDTIQLFHGSEVAFWPKAALHMSGILQAVPLVDGTEIILESTACGKGNYFYQEWDDAVNGRSAFEPIFVPWFMSKEYTLPLKEDFYLDEEEREYQALYKLTNEQMNWRKYKINELKSDIVFKQEYPSCAQEAFTVTGSRELISAQQVEKAQHCEGVEPYGIKFMGVDPAALGKDRTAIIRRQGRVAYNLEFHEKKAPMQVVGIVHKLILEERPDIVCIDAIGIGSGIADRLIELGHDCVKPIECSRTAYDERKYANVRAEMWGLMKDWLEDTPVSIPLSTALAIDLCSPQEDCDSKGRILLEGKQKMATRKVRSPDAGDALALTFAFPMVNRRVTIDNIYNPNIVF